MSDETLDTPDGVDPAAVVSSEPVTVFLNHNYAFENALGTMSDIRVEDGRLVGRYEGRPLPSYHLGIAGIVDEYHVENGVTVIDKFTLLSVGVLPDVLPAKPKEPVGDE